MNDLYARIDEVEQELKYLMERCFSVDVVDNVLIVGKSEADNKFLCKIYNIKVKDLVKLVDWLEEPKQLEMVKYLLSK